MWGFTRGERRHILLTERNVWPGLSSLPNTEDPRITRDGTGITTVHREYWVITQGRKKNPDFEGSFLFSYGICVLYTRPWHISEII